MLGALSPGDYPKGIRPEDFRDNPLSNPRNPHMMEIMKGLRFVKMISEGTKRMITVMERASLPMPEFSPSGKPNVMVTLLNDIDRRGAERWDRELAEVTSFANLFQLDLVGPPRKGPVPDEDYEPPDTQEIRNALIDSLHSLGYAVDSFTHSVAVDFRGEYVFPELRSSRIVSLYPAIKFRIFEFGPRRYLCLDYAVEVRNRATLDRLLSIIPGLINRRLIKGFFREENAWQPCFIKKFSYESVVVEPLGSPGTTATLMSKDVLPNLPTSWMTEALSAAGVRFNPSREIKRLSFS